MTHPAHLVLRCLALAVTLLSSRPAAAQEEGKDYPLGPIGGSYRVTPNSSAARISAITSGSPGAAAGLRVGDYLYGAFGEVFTPTGSYHFGVSQELGFAVDRAEAGDGILPLMIVRPGAGGFTANIHIGAVGALTPAYPRNSAKFAAIYETAVADLHSRAMNSNGSMGYFTGWTGLCLLGHPDWNQTTGPRPYRLAVNKVRDFVIGRLYNWHYNPNENLLLDGTENPNHQGGASNWELGQMVMFLAEYVAKTNDTTPITITVGDQTLNVSPVQALQRGAEMCANSVQWWKQPAQHSNGFSPEYAQVAGMCSHGGVTGDYMHQGWYCGINITGCYSFNGMAFSRRAGMDMTVRPKDGHYFGFNLNPGDPIPASIINALPTSIALPKYGADPSRGATIANTSNPLDRSHASDPFWYDMSLHQKFVMHLNFLARRSMWKSNGHNDDGMIGYAPEAITAYDAGGRTPGTLLGMAMYHEDAGGLDADDLDRMERLKGYITRNYMRHQEAHAYCVGAQAYQAMCAPYLSDRQQRFFMDNWRFFFALSRTHDNGIRYFPSRSVADNYLSESHCASINIALPYAVANGRYQLLPAYKSTRMLPHFKAPALTWPSLAARAGKVYASSQAFAVDVLDGDGNVMTPGTYTAAWSHVSGPATATFSPNNAADTTITFPSVSATPYRIRLTLTRTGYPTVTEDIDVIRSNAVTPTPNAITAHPASATAVPGGSASFSVTVSGSGPLLYQWRLNGTAYWGIGTSNTLSLSNLPATAAGTIDCVVTTPAGVLISNAATLSIPGISTRKPGGLNRKVWNNVGGGAVGDFTGLTKFPMFPDSSSVVTTAETPENTADNYGQMLSGWVVPPTTGNYRFFLSSDDASELWLSTDDTSANKVRIVNRSSWCSFRDYGLGSASIALVAGQRYYIEILHKEGGGGDHLSVAWQVPGGSQPANGSAPIGGEFLEYEEFTPLTDYWRLDETSGTTAVNSIRTSHHGTHQNGTVVNQGGATPATGRSAYYDGSNDQTQISAPNYNSDTLTIAAWVKRNGAVPAWAPILFTRAGNSVAGFGCGEANELRYHWNGGEWGWNPGLVLPDNQWALAVLVVRPTGATMHLRTTAGLQSVTQPATTITAEEFNGTMFIGADAGFAARRFKGNIDDVRVYKVALTNAGVEALWQNANAPHFGAANSFSVPESAAAGAAVGTVSASGTGLTYAITGGDPDGRFAIDPATGAVTVAAPLNHEVTPIHTLTVTATSGGSQNSAFVNVAVSDVAEPPAFPSDPVIGAPVYVNNPCSGQLTAVDPDLGAVLTYTKLAGPAWLAISPAGALTGTPGPANAGLNVFTVRATDNTGLFTNATLHITVNNPADAPVWIQPNGGPWPTAGNWFGGAVANGADITADFATLDLTANTTVTLDGARTIGGLKFADTAPSHDWTLAPGSGGSLTLQTATGTPVIDVANRSATIGAALAGTMGLWKSGAGTLVLTGANTYSGTTTLSDGVLQVGAGGTTGNLGGNKVVNNGILTFSRSDTHTVPHAISGSGKIYIRPGGTHTFSGPLACPVFRIDGGGSRTITFSGSSANSLTNIEDAQDGHCNLYFAKSSGVNAFSGPVLHVGSGYASQFLVRLDNHNQIPDTTTIQMYGWSNQYGGRSWFRLNGFNETIAGLAGGTSTSYVQNNAATASTLTLTGVDNYTLTGTMNNGSSGTLSLVMNGSGTQTLSGGSISYTGTTAIHHGTLRLTQATGFASTTTTVNAGGTLELASENTAVDNWRIHTVLAGAGAIHKTGNGWVQTNTNAHTFSGVVTIHGGVFGTANLNSNWSGITANFDVKAGALLDARGQAITIGGLNGQGTVGTTWTTAATVNLGAGNQSGSFSGTITGNATSATNLPENPNGGVLSLNKNGSGTQVLAGACSYSGATNVNGGTLTVNGSLASTANTTVKSSARLDGHGSLAGSVTLNSSATIGAGDAAATGTLTVGGLTLNHSGSAALRINKSGGATSADRIHLSGAAGLEFRGSLTVTVIDGAEPLAEGDRFTLFSLAGGSFSGSFATLNLPPPGAGRQWSTAGLSVDGSIEVISIVSTASPVFDPPAGAYIGPLQVTIATITTGATIHFTTDGSDPATSPTAVSAPAPVSGIEVSAPGTLTLRAYASKDGMADSTATTATYQTLPADGLIWTNPAGGSWPVTGNWLHGLVANGSGHVARFDTLTLVASPTVTLDTSPVVGGMVFGDVGNQHSWILASGSGGPLTLATPSGIPFIGVNNGSLTVSAVLAGSQGMLKDGPGILALTGSNTFTGGTLLRAGEVHIDKRGALGNGPVTLGDAQSGAAEIRLLQRGSDPWPPTDSWCENDITVAAGATGRVVIGRQNAGTYAANFTGTITLQNDMIFRNFGNDRLSIEGKITGTGNIVIEGSGRVNWNHPGNDFLGTITVAAGAIFQPNHPASVPATTAVTLHGNMGTNIATGETMTIGALHGNGNIYRLASGNPTLAIGANDADGSFGGAIQNDFSVTKTGAGIQTFSGTHTYTGPTAVNGGTLLINGSLAGGATTVAAAATLGGSGTIGGPVSNSGTLAPGGNGVGNLTITNTLTLAGGSNLAWEISDWTGSAGAGWDKITATSLNLTATDANRVTIKPSDLAPANFSETSKTFVIVQTTSGITGFSADNFTVDTTGLTVPRGTWAVQQSGNNLVLAYTAFNPDANGNGILDTWEIEKFGHANQGANPPDGDPEGDGLANLMEYALDTDPLAATTNPIVHDLVPPGDEQFLRLTIPKNPAATNLTYIVETCGALGDWSSANTTIEADTATQLIVRDNFTTATAARRFIRLKVISTTP